tara:strand:- start:4181 stop:5107 length:927 start_codon:yes stop_codon:yes gene_type:complete
MSITLMADHEYAARYLADGQVKVEGYPVDIVWPQTGAGSVYAQLFGDPPYDVMVIPMTNYLIALDRGEKITGIPVFPDVSFPHLGAQTTTQSGIVKPKDLEGKKVGIRGWGFNPGTWMRGILSEQYNVDLTKIEWVEAEPNSLMHVEYPRDTRFNISKGGDQIQELESGQLDAVFFDRTGPSLSGSRRLLFQDPLLEAMNFYEQFSFFPVNVMLVAKTSVLDANPGLASAILTACNTAREIYYDEVSDDDEHMGLPVSWLKANKLFPHRNGFRENLKSIEAIVRYTYNLGLISKEFSAASLFSEECIN